MVSSLKCMGKLFSIVTGNMSGYNINGNAAAAFPAQYLFEKTSPNGDTETDASLSANRV